MAKKKKPPVSRKAQEKLAYEKWLLSLQKLAPNFSGKPIEKQGKQYLKYTLSSPPGRETVATPSRVTRGGSTAPIASPQYTGTKVLGIGVMHKSNMVPIFAEEEAKDIATMRRS